MFKATYQAITKGKIPCGINYLFLHALCMPGFQINMHTRATVFQKHDHVSGKTTWCQGRLPLAQLRGQYYNSSHFTSWKHSQGQSCCWIPHGTWGGLEEEEKEEQLDEEEMVRWRMMFRLLVLSQAH
ncbi:hypothetical protein NC652_007396 [Populus alba x Populus x berolinensis]|nr:hypothetical protein NC652_007396 [Populus alba x Populus x berolinensis]